jgi:hypothetical protein
MPLASFCSRTISAPTCARSHAQLFVGCCYFCCKTTLRSTAHRHQCLQLLVATVGVRKCNMLAHGTQCSAAAQGVTSPLEGTTSAIAWRALQYTPAHRSVQGCRTARQVYAVFCATLPQRCIAPLPGCAHLVAQLCGVARAAQAVDAAAQARDLGLQPEHFCDELLRGLRSPGRACSSARATWGRPGWGAEAGTGAEALHFSRGCTRSVCDCGAP